MSDFDISQLEAVLRQRKAARPDGSYSVTLMDDPERAARKIVEEAFEVSVELMRPSVDHDRAVAEAADLVFHLLAGLAGADVPFSDVLDELERRRA